MSRLAILFVPIGYLGNKAVKKDSYFGTGLTFQRGQALDVPAETANKMLQHVDVYADANSERWKAFVAKLEGNGGKLDDTDRKPPERSAEEKFKEQVSALRAELNKITVKQTIKDHEVTQKLAVQFADDDKLATMTDKVVAAYGAHLRTVLELPPEGGE